MYVILYGGDDNKRVWPLAQRDRERKKANQYSSQSGDVPLICTSFTKSNYKYKEGL